MLKSFEMTLGSPVTLPFRLLPDFRERIWGIPDLSSWFPNPPVGTIGEAWFTAQRNATTLGPPLDDVLHRHPEVLGTGCISTYPDLCPLLVKLLFTSSRLSVQVHPKDDYAGRHHKSLGKTEAWFVIDAASGGEVALGFKEPISPQRFREAALSGEIETLLDWRPVTSGDTIFVPAGTVHAIGAGLTICEIQQNSDITYRLYDYGRPRELHLEHGSAVSDLGPYVHRAQREELEAGRTLLVKSDYFWMEHLRQKGKRILVAPEAPHYCLLVSLAGSGAIDGQSFSKGQVWMIPAGGRAVEIASDDAEWILAYPGSASAINLRLSQA